MRRARIDLAEVAAFQNLARATELAARGKRQRPAVRAFLADLEVNLDSLAQAILTARVPIGVYRPFRIHDPKPRLIHAACFPDRVLHHAIMQYAGPVLERTMTETSYACRPGKGTLAAVAAAQAAIRRYAWYVKVDVSGYFEHIDHAILLRLLARRFKGRGFLDLLGRIVYGFEAVPGRGLPIGSLTSQYFANYYLDGLDRLLLEGLGVRTELRYMDNVLWFCDSRDQAREALARVRDWLTAERLLQLKETPQINRCSHGVTFCGYRILSGALLLGRRRQRRYQDRRAHWELAHAAGEIDALALQRGYDAVCAIAIHADSRGWRCAELARHPAPEV